MVAHAERRRLARSPGRLKIVYRGLRNALGGNVTTLAAAIAYYSFLALPSLLLIAVGAFGLLAGRGAVETLVNHLSGVVPAQALSLLRGSLTRLTESGSGTSVTMIVVGFAAAVWSAMGAIMTLQWALNLVFEREDSRGFVRKRLVSLAMLALALVGLALAFGLLVLGPHLSGWVGRAVGHEHVVNWIWWTAQWPLLVLALLMIARNLVAFGVDGPARPRPRVTTGSLVAVTAWLVGSAAFALYTSRFASYNKTWGSLAAVIVLLTWLWLGATALLLGAAIDAEQERLARDDSPDEPASASSTRAEGDPRRRTADG
jgi:membrane protein